jgi:cell division initiation protein
MNVVPMDIKRQTFKRIFKGYDPEEVQTFLDMVSDQFDRVLKEKNELSVKLDKMQLEVEKYRTLEKSIQDTLESARRSTEEMKESATHGARLIVKEAEIEADHLMDEAARRRDALRNDVISLREQKKTFLIRMRSLLTAQLEMVQLLEKDPEDGTERPLPGSDHEEMDVSPPLHKDILPPSLGNGGPERNA